MTENISLKSKIAKYFDNATGYSFFTSTAFMLFQTVLAIVLFSLRQPNFSLIIFLIVMILVFVTCKDLSACLLPVLLASMSVLKEYGSTEKDYFAMIPLVVILVLLLIIRPFFLQVKFKKGFMFWPLLAVAISVTLGGLGSLSAKQYFDIIPLFYVISLGFGMLVVYLYIINYTFISENFDCKKVFVKTMLCVGLMGIFMMFPEYIEQVFIDKEIFFVQWANNFSTFLIIAMPFSFYMAVKNEKFGFLWILFALMQYFAIAISESRGGLIMGTITLFLCMIFTVLASKKMRFIYLSAFLIIFLCGTAYIVFAKGFLEELILKIKIDPDEARVGLIQVAIENFKNSPIFGAGLAYKGAHYSPVKWALYWYHSLPFQIIGSLGLVGIFAYGFIFYKRARICFIKLTKFSLFCLIAMVGFTFMGCVNPGEFAPFPFAFVITLIPAYVELNNSKGIEETEILKFPKRLKNKSK